MLCVCVFFLKKCSHNIFLFLFLSYLLKNQTLFRGTNLCSYLTRVWSKKIGEEKKITTTTEEHPWGVDVPLYTLEKPKQSSREEKKQPQPQAKESQEKEEGKQQPQSLSSSSSSSSSSSNQSREQETKQEQRKEEIGEESYYQRVCGECVRKILELYSRGKSLEVCLLCCFSFFFFLSYIYIYIYILIFLFFSA